MMKKICSIVSETLIPLDMPDKGQEKKQKIVAMRNASFKAWCCLWIASLI